MKRFSLLHAYRAVAILFIILFHLTQFFNNTLHSKFLINIFIAGPIGVDMFFVLTGFFIYYIHGKDLGDPTKVKGFLYKRFIRIFPPYWAALILTLGIYMVGHRDIVNHFFKNTYDLVSTILLLHTWPHPIPPAWSLTYQLVFYFLFAILILVKPRGLRLILASVFFLFVYVFDFIIVSAKVLPSVWYGYLHLDFLFGVIAAYAVQQIPRVKINYVKLLFLASLVVIALYWGNYMVEINMHSWIDNRPRIFLFSLPFAVIVAASVWLERIIKIKPATFLQHLATISYSLFLTHSIVLIIARTYLRNLHRLPQFYYPVIAFCLLLCIYTLGYLFYRFVEKPLTLRFRF